MQRLLEAGEYLFARYGVHGPTLRELNARAGQRNPSALHYHFGSRDGLVLAILQAHQVEGVPPRPRSSAPWCRAWRPNC